MLLTMLKSQTSEQSKAKTQKVPSNDETGSCPAGTRAGTGLVQEQGLVLGWEPELVLGWELGQVLALALG